MLNMTAVGQNAIESQVQYQQVMLTYLSLVSHCAGYVLGYNHKMDVAKSCMKNLAFTMLLPVDIVTSLKHAINDSIWPVLFYFL